MATSCSCYTAIRTLVSAYNSWCKGWSFKVAIKSPVVPIPIDSSQSTQSNLISSGECIGHCCWTTHQGTRTSTKGTTWRCPSVMSATTCGETSRRTIWSLELYHRYSRSVHTIKGAGIGFKIVSPENRIDSTDKVRLCNIECIWSFHSTRLHPAGSSIVKVPCVVCA
jgi:hypothetical protein